MPINLKQRTDEIEEMDDFAMEGPVLQDALKKLSLINKTLGGNNGIISGLKSLLLGQDKTKTYSIVDLGCGSGDILRVIADFARDNEIQVELLGLDANKYTITYAQVLSAGYSNIKYRVIDLFSEEFTHLKYDIAVSTLTMHHFEDKILLNFLSTIIKNANLGVVINDLHRSRAAYYLFHVVCLPFRLNKMSRNDGLISIKRGFKREDLERYSQELGLKSYSIQWKWAFRYQWIIRKT